MAVPEKLKEFFESDLARRCGAYLLKAVVMLGAIVLLARFSPSMSRAGIALCWAMLSAVSTIGIAYHLVIRKVQRQVTLNDEGLFSTFNRGRIVSLLVSFVVSAVLVAGLVLESPKWDAAVWGMVAATVPVYLGVYLLSRKVSATQYVEPYRTSKAVKLAIGVTGLLLCAGYAVFVYATGAPATYASVTEAVGAASLPFEGSPSSVLQDAGRLVGLCDGFTAYGLSRVSEVSFRAYLLWRIAICASAFFGVANLIGMCVLDLKDLGSVFEGIGSIGRESGGWNPVKRYVATACVLPVVLAAGFLYCDMRYTAFTSTQEYSLAQDFVRDKVGVAAYVLDADYYDQQMVDELMAQAQEASDALAREREEALVPLINAAFDKRVENVDSYLDWYYSLPADYEMLFRYFAGTIEEGMRDQLEQCIEEGVDDTELAEQLEYYWQRSQELSAEYDEKLQECKLEGVPDWLVVQPKPLEPNFMEIGPLASNQRFMDAMPRFVASTGAGVAAGIISAKVVQKVLAKPFFKKVVAKLTEKLAARGLVTAAGTLVAPGVGTAVGVVATTATDYLLLKADEAVNRESYRMEIVTAIEEQRAEMLAMVQAPA